MAEQAEVFMNDIPMAMRNMVTTQAREQMRYAYTRGGTYGPKPKQYRVGDFVCVKCKYSDKLDCNASPFILQIIRIKANYTLVLHGRDGRVISDHARKTSLCYLPDVRDEYDP